MTRHFLRDDDLTPAEQNEVLELALRLKTNPYSLRPLEGPQTAAVIFDKTSTRTRVSFAVGIADLGGSPLIIDSQTSQLGGKESIEDTAKVLSRMVSAIIWRTYSQEGLQEMAQHSTVPVINALSDDFHPCQVLADLLTVREHRGDLAGLTLTYLGDAANNMAHSYLLGCATAGMNVRIAGPEGYLPRPEYVADASALASTRGSEVWIGSDPIEAVTGSDVVVTDTWISMGQEAEKEERLQLFGDYRVTEKLFSHAQDNAIFLHCLPAYRDYEVSAEIIDGPRSVVWDEAENRVHAQKALLAWLLTQR
ncbi:ornithine carbamoyltransferase [Lysinibacter sp. HNR]|uniref:ornithine carbamoyltransferase n=1 Tax=Lysinibacter sp. HNR TaxID=3031408 RepID=UPI002435C299|nr:ornithine carbamoyltransferase [Lysinibacter sp. HNR]WGD37935.1 ornithine carbamoyltransferase [Lysinibacter sp. HNR]